MALRLAQRPLKGDLNQLIRVVTLHATVVASGPLAYLVGCGVEGRPLPYLE